MNERPDPGSVANDRQQAPADHLDNLAIAGDRGTRPVKGAVAQDESIQLSRVPYRVLQVFDGAQGPAESGRRVGVEGSLFSPDGSASRSKFLRSTAPARAVS